MTKQEQNNIIEGVWQKKLQTTDSLPEDVANKYSVWLRDIIRQAAGLLVVGQAAERGQEGQEEPQQEQGQEAG